MRRSGKTTPPNPLAERQRQFRRSQALGPDAVCAFCGESCPDLLRKAPGQFVESHHPFGYQHDPDSTVVVCVRCHALVSARQTDDAVDLRPAATVLERIAASEGALGSHFITLGNVLLERARRVRMFVDGLDRDYHGWRDKPWAK